MKTKNLKIFVILLNILFVLAVMSSCKSSLQTSLEYHQGLQVENSYANYMSSKNQIKRAKDLKKAKQEQEAIRKQEARLKAKLDRINND